MIKCPACQANMIWNCDYDLSEVAEKEDKGVVSVHTCSNESCGSEFVHVQRERVTH